MVIARAGLVIEVSQPLSEIIQYHRFSAHLLYGKNEIASNAGVNTGLSGSKANLHMVIIIIIIIIIML